MPPQQKRARQNFNPPNSQKKAKAKAKSLASPDSAAVSNAHPTAEFVSDFILEPLQAELKKLSSTAGPKDYAGLRAFSKESFKDNMLKHTE